MKIALYIFIALVLLIILILWFANIRMNRMVENEIAEMCSEEMTVDNRVITEESISNYPEPLKKYIRFVGAIGKKPYRMVVLKQEGMFTTDPGKKPVPITARQYVRLGDKPAFLWFATLKMAPGVFVKGRDKYISGKGNMLIKLLGTIKVVEAAGPEIDQGSAYRLASEAVWYPTYLTSKYYRWEPIDDNHVKMIFDDGHNRLEGVIAFDDDGRLIEFRAERYMEKDGKSVLAPWVCTIGTEYFEADGIKIPKAASVKWILDTGEYTYYDLKVTELKFFRENPLESSN